MGNINVLVTGADGFIGSHLTELLVEQNYRVRALAQYNSFNDWGWLETTSCLNDVEVVTGDIRDPDCCRELCKGVDVVMHLAALIAIPYSYTAPTSYVDTNVKGTVNLLQAARDHGISKFVHTSTSEVYGTAQYVPIDEQHPLQPQSPYSASKIAADAMAMSFYHSFEMPITIARPFNTYGPRQSARAIIPTVISQIASGMKQLQVGNTTPTRDFNFVKDTCHGFISLLEHSNTNGQTINIGSNAEITILDTIKMIKELMHSDIELIVDEQRLRPDNSEVNRLWCENKQIKALTGYQPRYSLEDGLLETIKWFQDPANLKRYKAGIYNV